MSVIRVLFFSAAKVRKPGNESLKTVSAEKLSHKLYGVSDMDGQYSNPKKLHWLADVDCNSCSGEVNSWDKRCSRALGYKYIVCENCIAREYDVTVQELRATLQDHFGLIPCPGI